MKPSSLRNLLIRALLFLISVFIFRYVYVVTVHGGSCIAGDYCIFSSPEEPLVSARTSTISAAIAAVHVGLGSDANPEFLYRRRLLHLLLPRGASRLCENEHHLCRHCSRPCWPGIGRQSSVSRALDQPRVAESRGFLLVHVLESHRGGFPLSGIGITVHGGSCIAGDYCIFSSPEEPLVSARTSTTSAAIAAVHVGLGSDANPAFRVLWTSREWRKAVDFYSSMFLNLIAEGFLSLASVSLCVDTPVGYEVLALKEIGIAHAVGVAKKRSVPLVVAGGDPLRLPFENGTFGFVFADRSLDRTEQPADLASEISRMLKPHCFLVVLTASAQDAYSLHSLTELFPAYTTVRSRKITSLDYAKPLMEIVLQKQEGAENVGSNKNSGKKCRVPEHKLHILRSAEPLIKEEPLKPWITLKRNIQNARYLPSVADISFKQHYIYMDVGARSYGSSIGNWFSRKYPKQNHTFKIYAIEADRAFHGEYATKKGVNFLPFAAWVRNESLTFEINHDPDNLDAEKGRGMGRIRPVRSNANGSVSPGDVHSVQGFDFAAWLKRTVTAKDYVVMKMDVEGTEFDLVPRLFETGAICLIDELFLECHYNRWQKCCPGQRSPKYQKTYEECLEMFILLRDNGVLVHQWW